MGDPLTRSSAWPQLYEVYAEKHKVYEVFLEAFREIILKKPKDPLAFVRDEIQRIAHTLHVPRTFVIGDPLGKLPLSNYRHLLSPYAMNKYEGVTKLDYTSTAAQDIGREIATKTGAIYLSIDDVSQDSTERQAPKGRNSEEEPPPDEEFLKKVYQRLSMEDCEKNGYVIGGFPRTKLEALYTQQCGIIPRLVVALLPEPIGATHEAQTKKQKAEWGILNQNAKSSLGVVGEMAGIYDRDVCQILPYKLWSSTPIYCIVEDVLSLWSLKSPVIPTWHPKIAIVGPPSAGKSTLAIHLSERFQILRVDWGEAVRGATNSKDAQVSCEAKRYLENLEPLSKSVVCKILQSRLHSEECLRKGWILDGFPQNKVQAEILDEMALTPNRIVLLSAPEAVCKDRIVTQRENAYARKIPPQLLAAFCRAKDYAGSKVPGTNPYSEDYICLRFCEFDANLDDIIDHYCPDIVEVDGSQPAGTVKDIVETFVLRPPA